MSQTIPCTEAREGVTVCTYQAPYEPSTLDQVQEVLATLSMVIILIFLLVLTYSFLKASRKKPTS